MCRRPSNADRAAYPLPALPPLRGFHEIRRMINDFKTPSLFYISDTAPYFHDGSVATLEQLVEGNNDRVGKTKQRSPSDHAHRWRALEVEEAGARHNELRTLARLTQSFPPRDGA